LPAGIDFAINASMRMMLAASPAIKHPLAGNDDSCKLKSPARR
jgi:hypothetical protein